jgi:hypothetical protein
MTQKEKLTKSFGKVKRDIQNLRYMGVCFGVAIVLVGVLAVL